MTSGARKVVIVSLDGATFDVLDPLIQQGRLPNLRKLRQNGVSAPLASVIPAVTPPAWTSFMTGKHPAKHGVFCFTNFSPSEYRWYISNSRHIQSKTLWQILSEKEKRVLVVNLPMTYPPYPVNGVMVSGWDSVTSNFTYPPELGKQIQQMVPGYDSSLWLASMMQVKSRNEFDQFIEKLTEAAKQSTTLALQLLNGGIWDVFMIHFHQTDWMQHKLWADIERACIPGNHDYRAERVRECYQCLDECIGTVLSKTAAEDPLVVVLSDHGFGPHRGDIRANYYLKSWGYLNTVAMPTSKWDPFKDLFRKSKLMPVRRLYQAMANARRAFDRTQSLEDYKQKYGSWVDRSTQNCNRLGHDIDWKRTTVIGGEQYQCAFLYVNLVGRCPSGTVHPGSEYETVVSELIARFEKIRHPVTGEKLLARVERGCSLFPESNPEVVLPDIVLVPAEGYKFDPGIAEAPPTPSALGIHHPNGVLFLHGRDVSTSVDGLRPSLVDVAPTILHYLGLPVPSDMDGRVLGEAFSVPAQVSYEEADNAVPVGNPVTYSAEDSAVIEQRLRGLGYIE